MKYKQKAKRCIGCNKPFLLPPSLWHLKHCSFKCWVDFDRKWMPAISQEKYRSRINA